MNPSGWKMFDVLPIVVGIVFVSSVDFVQDGEVAKNWRYGYPVGLEKVVGVAAFICGAINFRFIIRLIYMCLRTQWTSLKFLLDDFAVRFVCESFAAALGTLLAGHWWIRYNSLSRCVRNPEGKACEYEPQLIVEFQRILLNMVYSKPEDYPDFLDGCKPPPFNTFAYFVHALPALVYTVCLGLFAYYSIQGGNSGGGGGGNDQNPCEELSPCRPCEDFSPKGSPGCPPSDDETQGGDLSEELPEDVKKKLDKSTTEEKKKPTKKEKKKPTKKEKRECSEEEGGGDDEDFCEDLLLDNENGQHVCETCKRYYTPPEVMQLQKELNYTNEYTSPVTTRFSERRNSNITTGKKITRRRTRLQELES